MERTTSFCHWLRRQRKVLDLTQEEMARQVGCALITIKKLEGHERRPSRQFAERLADVLQLPPEERPAFLKAARAELAAGELALAAQPIESPGTAERPAEALPSSTITFLFTDIEGSSQMWARHSEAMRAALTRHDALLRMAIEAHGGVVFKTVSDAFHAAFVTAVDALTAALAAQRTLMAEAWGASGPLRVRMALHSGMAEARDGDYFGHTLNRIARLLSAGHGGQILLSAATWELLRDHLPPDVTLRDLGLYWLKSLPRPEQIYQLLAPDLPSDFPPLHTLDQPTTNLPAQPTAFIGREREVAAVRALLCRADVRHLTLTGPGGSGKTRLALQAAADLLDTTDLSLSHIATREGPQGKDHFPDGVWFVNLAPLNDPSLVAATIAQTFSVRETGGQPIQEVVKSYLCAKRLLLLLDNFEQIAEAAPLIGDLLASAPGLTVLVTSRMPLHLSGEHEYAVPPLGLPPRPSSLRPLHTGEGRGVQSSPLLSYRERQPGAEEDLTQYEAARLFIERAQAVKADFAITNDNAPAVAEICHRLDGLPLAIELAAARTKLFPPQALLTRLDNRLKLLTNGARDLPARQQTIRNTIDWSYQLLDAGEQTLFARLGVFVSGCTLEGAEAVCNTDADLPMEVIDGIAALLDQSLLRQDEGIDGEPRLVMLETIREYALERLAERGETDILRRRHVEYYLALTEAAEKKLRSAAQHAWLDLLESEHNNLRAALSRSRATNEIVSGLQLVGLLLRFWVLRGHYSEGRRWTTDFLACANKSEPTVDLAWALTGAAELAWLQGDIALAESQTDEILTLWRGLRDKRGLAYTLDSLANVCWPLGQIARGRAMVEESLRLFEELEDLWDIAQELSGLGNFHQWQGDYPKAHSFLEKALRIARAEGFSWIIAHALMGLGRLAQAQRNLTAARNYYEESLEIYRSIGDQGMIGNLLGYLSGVTLLQEDLATSMAFAEEAQKLFCTLGDHLSLTEILNRFGNVARSQDDFERAAHYYRESLILCHQTGNVLLPPTIHANLGYVALHQGDLAQATLQFTEGLTLLRQLSFTAYGDVVLGFVGFATVAMRQGHSECAARLLGAVESLGGPLIIDLIPALRADHDRVLTAVRAQLDDASFASAWEVGRALTLEQAFEEALGRGV